MENLVRKLDKLPKAKMKFSADLRIRKKLYFLIMSSYLRKFYSFLRVKKLTTIAIAIVFLFVSVIPGYAYTSPKVYEGTILFELKKNLENLELSFANDPAKKSTVLTKLATRRIDEARVIADKPEISTSTLISTLMSATNLNIEADTFLDKVDESSKKVEIKIESSADKAIKNLDYIAGKIDLNKDEVVLDNLALALSNFKNIKYKFIENKTNDDEDNNFNETEIKDQSSSTSVEKEIKIKEEIDVPSSSSSDKTNNVRQEIDKQLDDVLGERGDEIKKIDKELNKQRKYMREIEENKKEADKLEKDLINSEYNDDNKVKIYFEHLNKKYDSVIDQIKDDDNNEKIEDELEKTEALKMNAEHFIKKSEPDNEYEKKELERRDEEARNEDEEKKSADMTEEKDEQNNEKDNEKNNEESEDDKDNY